MLEQTGLHLAAFPDAPFRLANWTMHGHHCILDKTPDRMLDIQVCPPLPCPQWQRRVPRITGAPSCT